MSVPSHGARRPYMRVTKAAGPPCHSNSKLNHMPCWPSLLAVEAPSPAGGSGPPPDLSVAPGQPPPFSIQPLPLSSGTLRFCWPRRPTCAPLQPKGQLRPFQSSSQHMHRVTTHDWPAINQHRAVGPATDAAWLQLAWPVAAGCWVGERTYGTCCTLLPVDLPGRHAHTPPGVSPGGTARPSTSSWVRSPGRLLLGCGCCGCLGVQCGWVQCGGCGWVGCGERQAGACADACRWQHGKQHDLAGCSWRGLCRWRAAWAAVWWGGLQRPGTSIAPCQWTACVRLMWVG